MQQTIDLKLTPEEAASDETVLHAIANKISIPLQHISGYTILKRSIDARSRQPWINLKLFVSIKQPHPAREKINFRFQDVSKADQKVIIVGAGPAGLFAALQLIESGIQPILLERGKDVKSRRRDLAAMNKQGIVNPESNYCFGEGGAGTYSDGKLFTRSNKRGDIDRILHLFVHFGADEKILYDAHPHIGTNKLPQIITAMREQIIESGGQVLFDKKVVDFRIKDNAISAVSTADGHVFDGAAVILATGHSARDIFYLLHEKKILIEAKPFALGVRAEHPQELIDQAQYKCDARGFYLPPASYSLVQQVQQVGVFSFCMCPGGIIAPAATAPGEIVVNGWSPSKRNNPYANSGIVVQVQLKDVMNQRGLKNPDPLSLLNFQEEVEQRAFAAGGGDLQAPAQRMVDFCANKVSQSLPKCSYLPGITSADLSTVLPPFIHHALQKAFVEFGKKMPARYGGKGYYTNEAVLVATESRTSSPVRIPRDAQTLQHPQIKNLYPCGEGAGYAGGIVSAAMDGERVAKMIAGL
ncbi:NAD(P)/FAD-dependent oxidoreductase [Niabella insulamsoli]|uniref:NAD(P)/FAD-dependent oxidoreductase n=1 Tax=Niabella insulamsoli TaxID=3144874 RepID=UPI0031FD0E53